MRDKEVGIRLCELEIKAYKEALEKVSEVKEIVSKFDGKVFNKRLSDELNGNRYIYQVDKNNYLFSIYYLPDAEFVANIRSKDKVLLVNVSNEDAFTENKRINADAINADIDERVKDLKVRIKDMEGQLSIIDSIIADRERLISEVEAFNNLLNSELNDNFEMEIRYKKY